jgi:ribosomal protein L9
MHLLQTQHNITLEKRFILLAHPIKEVGVHTIKLKLKEGVAAEVILKVVPEESEGSAES